MTYLIRFRKDLLVLRLRCPNAGSDAALQILQRQALEDEESVLTLRRGHRRPERQLAVADGWALRLKLGRSCSTLIRVVCWLQSADQSCVPELAGMQQLLGIDGLLLFLEVSKGAVAFRDEKDGLDAYGS